jgi:hypothetical protein
MLTLHILSKQPKGRGVTVVPQNSLCSVVKAVAGRNFVADCTDQPNRSRRTASAKAGKVRYLITGCVSLFFWVGG